MEDLPLFLLLLVPGLIGSITTAVLAPRLARRRRAGAARLAQAAVSDG